MRRVGVGLFVLVCVSAPAAAQQIAPVTDIERVRTLYVAAAYAEALAAIPASDGEPARMDLEQYRALCLLALGREPEAVSAIERVVRDHPTYVPPAAETTPRMLSMFASARSKLVPDLAKRAYVDAKAAYDKNDKVAANAGFRRTLDLIDSVPEAEKSSLDDLRLLASGFLDLSTVPARPAAPAPEPVGTKPAATPAASADGAYAPPVPIREELPTWNPPDPAARRTEYEGLLRVQIGADGKVVSATMVRRTHPTYDVAALRAAKSWIYQPATRGGEPVASQKDIQVKLLPK
jgi:TonB family protein